MKRRKAESVHADSVTAAIAAAQAAAAGDIPPPSFMALRDGDVPFWNAVTRARARDEWTEADLIAAVELAQTMADTAAERALLSTEGSVLTNERGTPVANPRFSVLQSLAQRQMALRRALQLQPTVNGKTARDMARKRETERRAREVQAGIEAEEAHMASLLA